jgi:hypothetical protein
MFTLIHIPDTQIYCRDNPAAFNAQTQWIVDNKDAKRICFVTHTGDVVDDADSTTQYDAAKVAMDKLTGIVPYSVTPGNHDIYNTANFIANFGGSKFAWYGGYKDDELSSWQEFEVDNVPFLHVSIKYGPSNNPTDPTSTLYWANAVIDAHPVHRTIISAHSYLYYDNPGFTNGELTDSSNGNGQGIWTNLVFPHSNVFMVLCGHNHGVWTRSDVNIDGQPVVQMLADYQDEPDTSGLYGAMRIIEIPTTET